MTICSVCKGTEDQTLIRCDKCDARFCEKCSTLAPTEWRSATLKKRAMIFLCTGCKVSFSKFLDFTPVTDSSTHTGDQIRFQLDAFAKSLMDSFSLQLESRISTVLNDITTLRDSNKDMIRLLSDWKQDSTAIGSLPSTVKAGNVQSFSAVLQRPVVGKNGDFSLLPGSSTCRDTLNSTPETACIPDASALDSSGGRRRQKPIVAKSRDAGNSVGFTRRSRPIVGSKKLDKAKIVAANLQKKTSVLVSRLDRGVSVEYLRDYLSSTFGDSETFVIEEQTVRSGDYKCFRVEIKLDLLDMVLNPDNWPVNIYVKRFRFFRAGAAVRGRQSTS